MARIGRSLNIPTATTGTGETEATSGSTTGLSPEQKFNLLMTVAVGIGVVSLLTMLTMLASWWQFANNASVEYSKIIREYQDKRYDMLENRVKDLESKVASLSGK